MSGHWSAVAESVTHNDGLSDESSYGIFIYIARKKIITGVVPNKVTFTFGY